jgi:hypothetical protein
MRRAAILAVLLLAHPAAAEWKEITRGWAEIQTSSSGVPGGLTTQVQFNDLGAFAGDSAFVWDKTNNVLTLGGAAGNLTKTLTESSATGFVEIAVAAGTVASVEIDYEVEANDATDYQVLSGTLRVNGVNKAGTLSLSIGEAGTQVTAASSGTLTCTNSVSAGTAKFVAEANCVSSLTQTVLRIKYFLRSAKAFVATPL